MTTKQQPDSMREEIGNILDNKPADELDDLLIELFNTHIDKIKSEAEGLIDLIQTEVLEDAIRWVDEGKPKQAMIRVRNSALTEVLEILELDKED